MSKCLSYPFKTGLVTSPVLSLTDQGTVQKVVVLPANSSASSELILEELEVFKVGTSLLLVSEHA